MIEHYHINWSKSEAKARKVIFWALMAATLILTTAATFGVVRLAGTSWSLALLTALVWTAWIGFSLWIIKGINKDAN